MDFDGIVNNGCERHERRDCGFFGNNSLIWILVLICLCGGNFGCGNKKKNHSNKCCDNGIFGFGSEGAILVLLLLFCCCGGNRGFF